MTPPWHTTTTLDCGCRLRAHPLDIRLVSGTVDHGNGIALASEDIDDGYLLACQATPRSPEVEIEIE